MTIGHALAPPDISSESGNTTAPGAPRSLDLEPIVPASVRGVRMRTVPRWLRRAVGPLLLLALWQVLSATGVLHADVLASPGTIARAGSDLIADGTLPSAMGISLQRVAAGLVLGGVVGTALALVSGLSRLGEDLVDASVQMLRTVPWVGLIPLFIIWLGIGEAPKVALIALGVAFHLYLNVYAGIRGVDAQLIESGEPLGLGRWGLTRHVVLPGALPGAMTGLRYSLPYEVALDAVGRSSGTRVSVAVDPAVIASEQAIADTFADLKLIPRRFSFKDYVDTRFNRDLPPSSTAPRSYGKASS
ncbi:ABC transporter permease subunit [Streptomyces sp. NPDC059802]|uniref:ABC transporter permease n=1 Tax=Streptomyces sp. NPDC059802 TaxID=3346952 RepID=UPI0036542683